MGRLGSFHRLSDINVYIRSQKVGGGYIGVLRTFYMASHLFIYLVKLQQVRLVEQNLYIQGHSRALGNKHWWSLVLPCHTQ